ncbi:MAG: transketolase [Dehalococcoidia bacterium]
MATMAQAHDWRELAQQLRVDSIRSTTAAGSGHPTSSMSAADLMAVLLARHLRYDFDRPDLATNDHFILSKGHASPLLYAFYKAAGAISDDELLTLRQFGSRLEGHPTPVLPWVDVATGSLGQGLPIGIGVALVGKYLDKLPFNVWVLMGDSEMTEGSVWEAIDKAGHYRLGNLIGIIDVNRLGQRGETELGWNTAAYAERARAFGWEAVEIDGHNLEEIDSALSLAGNGRDTPLMIVARTAKGKGVSFIENKDGWHGKALSAEQADAAIKELGGERRLVVKPQAPPDGATLPRSSSAAVTMPHYDQGTEAATRKVFGESLRALGARPDVVVLDAEVSNSTHTEDFAEVYPDRFFQMWIAEQQMVAAAEGMAVMGKIAFAGTFAAFLSRAYDFIRMGAISRVNLRLSGSHAGVSIGEDGPSQMALEDLAMMRAVHGSTVLYPCDANQTAQLVQRMADQTGISYMRTTREKTPVIYDADEPFDIGGSKVVRRSATDRVTIVGAGVTVHQALEAAERLAAEGIAARVIDAYSVKPIDGATLRAAAAETSGLIVVEDHWPEGGLGDAVLAAFADAPSQTEPAATLPRVVKLAVRIMPGSGTPEELRAAAGIDANAIVEAARAMVGRT